jgi:hypothetical protein
MSYRPEIYETEIMGVGEFLDHLIANPTGCTGNQYTHIDMRRFYVLTIGFGGFRLSYSS